VREMTTMAAMMVALMWLGLYPQPVLDLAQPVLDSLHALVPPVDITPVVPGNTGANL